MNAIDQNTAVTGTSFRAIKSNTVEKPDLKTASKQMETVFLNEIMRVMLEQTSLGQDKTVSTFLPVITSEISKSMAERGIGLGDFLFKNPPPGLKSDPGSEKKGILSHSIRDMYSGGSRA